MPTTSISETISSPTDATHVAKRVETILVCLPSMAEESRHGALASIRNELAAYEVLVASPEHTESGTGSLQPVEGIHEVAYAGPRPQPGWVLAAGDYLAAGALAEHYQTNERTLRAVIVLGAETLTPVILGGLTSSVQRGADVAVPCLISAPSEGLVSAALLYPLTRALFVADVRSPLPFNIALSPRALARLTPIAQRLAGNGSLDALLWPVAESAIAGLAVEQVTTHEHALTQPQDLDFNTLFASVAASLFADIEAKATFWQRARSLAATPSAPVPSLHASEPTEEMQSLTEGFQLAYANLQQIWSLVLPPQTLLSLKKLSQANIGEFVFATSLWARIVYDFILAFHLRTINRGHLLGAFTPLYLAWVASHLRAAGDDAGLAAQHVERTAVAFETERPYLVARWRWPDRFNP